MRDAPIEKDRVTSKTVTLSFFVGPSPNPSKGGECLPEKVSAFVLTLTPLGNSPPLEGLGEVDIQKCFTNPQTLRLKIEQKNKRFSYPCKCFVIRWL